MGRAPQRWRVVAVGVVTTDRERSGWPAVEGGKQIPVIAAAARDGLEQETPPVPSDVLRLLYVEKSKRVFLFSSIE
ncbi:hypothetical protein Bca101_075440 [Brassica carinata]